MDRWSHFNLDTCNLPRHYLEAGNGSPAVMHPKAIHLPVHEILRMNYRLSSTRYESVAAHEFVSSDGGRLASTELHVAELIPFSISFSRSFAT